MGWVELQPWRLVVPSTWTLSLFAPLPDLLWVSCCWGRFQRSLMCLIQKLKGAGWVWGMWHNIHTWQPGNEKGKMCVIQLAQNVVEIFFFSKMSSNSAQQASAHKQQKTGVSSRMMHKVETWRVEILLYGVSVCKRGRERQRSERAGWSWREGFHKDYLY